METAAPDSAPVASGSPNTEGWKGTVGWVSAILMALLWLVAGLWKLSDISGFQLKLNQLLVPAALTLPATLAVAVSEVFAGILLLRPAWRRLGGLFSIALLVVFMVYIGYHYQTLLGEDCSCFPWLERAVGPAFFWSDGAMIVIAALAAWFAPKMAKFSQARTVLAGVLALAVVAYGWDRFGPQPGSEVPATITVADESYALREGKVMIFFFNPQCLHCLDVGLDLSRYTIQSDFLGVPTQEPESANGFLEDAGLTGRVKLSPDLDLLKETFPFDDVPYIAVIEDGKILERFQFFDQPEFGDKLKELGVVK